MAELSPTGGKSKQKKKSAPAKTKRRAPTAPAVKKPMAAAEQAPVTMGRMERTRRLLLAALRVWELKRRPME